MTDLLVDLASYQAGIDLFRPAFAAWNRVNIKTSQGNWYVANRQRSRAWADQARVANKGIMTFHWLDMSDTGANQARIAYQEMRELGGPDGMAHQADTEDDGKTYGPMTYRVWRDYVRAMQDLMGRHVINYTGDWWWQPRGWDGASVTPYLMAAPNAGYLGSYPGDNSPHWNAGYGGWNTLAAMQYRVGGIPNGGLGAGSVSMTAIRDPQVWAALTGGDDDMAGEIADAVLSTLDGRNALGEVYLRILEGRSDVSPEYSNDWNLKSLHAKVGTLATTVGELAARPAPGTIMVTDEQLERVLRRVMGSVDGASPATS